MKTCILLLCALSAQPSSAALLANYDFSNESNRTAATNADPRLTAGAFSSTSSIGLPARPVIYPGWAAAPTSEVDGTGSTPGNETTSVSGQDYFSITLTPTTGQALTPTSLNFSTAFYTVSSGAATLTGNFFVRTSVDNFATTIGSIFSESHVVAETPAFTPREVLFSGSQYQNLTSPVTVRIYLYDNSNSPTRYLAVDDITLSGEITAIPESSAIPLLFVSCVPFARRRRASLLIR